MSFPGEKSYRTAVFFFLLLVLANALAAGLRTVSESDMGWHLATGRYVVQHHSIPSTDVLSSTAAGEPWVYPPFAGVLLYLIYSAAGYAGLSWFCAFACVGTVAYLVRKRDLASIVLAMCAVEAIAFRTGPRADLFNTVFLTIFLGELWAFQRGASKRLWLLPIIMLIWVNFHPGFILGLAVIGAYLVLEACDLPFAERRGETIKRLRQVWPWLAGTAGVTLLNPWGPKLYLASLTLAGLKGSQQGGYNTSSFIDEFLSVPISSHTLRQLVDIRYPENGYSWLMLIAVFVMALALWRKQFGVMVIEGVALYYSLLHVRYIGLFCIATTILGGTILGDAFTIHSSLAPSAKSSTKRAQRIFVPGVPALLFVCAVCAVTLLHTADFISNRTHVVFHTESCFGAGEASWFPERAASFIRHERLPGNIFQEYSLGGFAAWRLGPEYPDFIDGRFDHLAPAVLVEEQNLLTQPADSLAWQQAADKWGINVLLISEAEPRSVDRQDAEAFCQSENWRPVYMDEVSLVLLRNVPANRPWIDRLQIDCQTQKLEPPPSASRKDLYDYLANAGGMFYALRRDQESEAALLHAAALYPKDPNAKLLLAQIYQRHQMFDKAEEEYRASLALNETDKPWFELGRLYARNGHYPEAEQALSRAAQISVKPFLAYWELAHLELWLQHPEPALRALDEAANSSPYRNGGESLAPELYAEIADDRADANRMLVRLPQAIEFEQESVRLNPSVAKRWSKLADLYQSAGHAELSQQARARAQELERTNGAQ